MGRILSIGTDGLVNVEFNDEYGIKVAALVAEPLDREAVEKAIVQGSNVLVTFPQGCGSAVVMAVVASPAKIADTQPCARRIESRHAIVLRSGKSSITLKPDGKVEIFGADITTRAVHTQRIQASTVEIN